MDLETTFHGLLGLDDSWEVNGVDYDDQQGKFFIVITETDKLWEKETCPDPDCKGSGITCHDHVPTRAWRHLDAFGKRSELLCNLPRGKLPGVLESLPYQSTLGRTRQAFHDKL
jgi:hypothetical protein